MEDNYTVGMRVLSIAIFDWSLALACGWLLAAYWLRHHQPWIASGSARFWVRFPGLRVAAILMAISLIVQFYVLTVTLTGNAGLANAIASAPSVASTHGGSLTLYMLCASLLLWAADAVASPKRATVLTRVVIVSLVVLIVAFHSAVGHAATDGDFSVAELLQFLHISGMAVWVGGVVVSGLFVAPRLVASLSRVDEAYLRALSNASAYSVLVVLLSGMYKSWIGLDRQLSGMVHTMWGRILMGKLCLVAIALALGFLHRHWIRQHRRLWTPNQTSMLLKTLRAEAYCLTLVIAVSAWLSSVDPAGT
jgi:putative copper resistance protein D